MTNNLQPIHILIADDQETDSFFMGQAFGHSTIENVVHIVKDGQEALDFLMHAPGFEDKPRPHLIVMDINMPRKGGVEALSEIKADKTLCDIPVIIVSGSQAPDDIVRSYKNHANAYVPKSNGFEDMLNFVNAIEKFWFVQARLPVPPSDL